MLLMLCGLLVSCGGLESSAHRLEKQIARQTAVAVEITEGVVSLLGSSSVDSLLSFTTENREVLFYVFNDYRLVYWSQNGLSGGQVHINGYDRWYYQLFDNARWLYHATTFR